MGARRIQAQRRRSPSAAAGAEGPILGSGPQSVRGTGPRFALAVLLAVSVFNQIDRTILSTLQVPLKRDLHLSDLQLGALTGLSFAAVYCAFTVPVSRLADRLPRTRLMAVALALWSLTTALSGLATTFAMLVLCRMGLALGESCCSPATLSLLSDYFPLKRRGVPIAIWTMSVPFGTMFGLIAGGWLSQSLGWRQAFVDVGAAGLALSPALLLLREPPRGRFDSPREPAPPTTLREAAAILWGSYAFRGMLLGGALWSFAFCAMQAWSAPFYVRIHGLPLATAGGWLAVVFGVGGGGGALLGGALTDRLSRRDAGVFGRIPAIGCLLAIRPRCCSS